MWDNSHLWAGVAGMARVWEENGEAAGSMGSQPWVCSKASWLALSTRLG